MCVGGRCVWGGRGGASVCVCMCVWRGARVCVCVGGRCVCVGGRGGVSVCVCVGGGGEV